MWLIFRECRWLNNTIIGFTWTDKISFKNCLYNSEETFIYFFKKHMFKWWILRARMSRFLIFSKKKKLFLLLAFHPCNLLSFIINSIASTDHCFIYHIEAKPVFKQKKFLPLYTSKMHRFFFVNKKAANNLTEAIYIAAIIYEIWDVFFFAKSLSNEKIIFKWSKIKNIW